MKQEYRINGGLVNRSKPISFTFNNKQMTGYEGDTLASALLANGQRLVGRSFKYHRPRGIFSSGLRRTKCIGSTPLWRTSRAKYSGDCR
jgi:sarcosine oxidase subunit alpha